MVAEKAYDYVRRERLMSQHYEERLDWYFELLQRLPELTAEAEARVKKFIPLFKDEIDKFRARFAQGSSPLFPVKDKPSDKNAPIIIPE